MSTVLDKAYETHEQFLTRRSTQMAGMIGLLSSRLEIIEMNLKFDMKYNSVTPDVDVIMWQRSAKQSRMEILECLIKYQHEWASMQEYEEGDYGMNVYKRKVEEYTTELEALKTLAL
jgi:hypothetical protein